MNRQASRPATITAMIMMATVGCRHAAAIDAPRAVPLGSSARSVAGELIIKLTPQAGKTLTQALVTGESPTNTGLPWFDALNRRYGVTMIEPIFPHSPNLDAIRHQYPERARRAPPGAEEPSVAFVYKLTMRADADPLEAAVSYGSAPGIVYAEPNYVVTIQPALSASPGKIR